MEFLNVYQFDKKVRLGCDNDGGYVIGDIKNYDCYISAGVSIEESFSRDFIPMYGMNKSNSFAFDGTIYDYPWNFTKEIQFFKKNISSVTSPFSTNLHMMISSYKNIFLKMDIEGGEYPWLLSLTKEHLENLKQITVEFHGIHDNSYGSTLSVKNECLKKLSETHYLIHVHGNNWGNSKLINNNLVPDVIELTYVRKTEFTEVPLLNNTKLPMHLDKPNKVGVPDFNLSFPPFYTSQDS